MICDICICNLAPQTLFLSLCGEYSNHCLATICKYTKKMLAMIMLLCCKVKVISQYSCHPGAINYPSSPQLPFPHVLASL